MSHLNSPPKELRVSDIRKVMPEDRHRRSLWKALLITWADGTAYTVALFGIVFVPTYPGKIVWAMLTGLVAAMCYALAHDACHLDLTDKAWLDRLIGRCAFLPSLHPFTAWELAHNRLHHGWTNLRGKDHVHAPHTKAEFDSWPLYRQVMERVYRSVLGIGFLYLGEWWVKHAIWLRAEDKALLTKKKLATHRKDLALLFTFSVFQALALVGFSHFAVAHFHVENTPVWALLLIGIVWPFLVCHWLLAFVTLLHHTHPHSKWFNDEKEWSFYEAQVQGTVHITFPRLIELLFHESMEHTAHHVDPKIPLYNLRPSQKSVEDAFNPDVIIEHGSLRHLRRVLAKCRLYDYENHRWLDFDGTPTT